MFLRGFLCLFFISGFFKIHAQNFIKPNYKRIKKQIKKKNSDYYYPTIFKKFKQGVATMSLKEKQYLYLGYAFQKNYEPYAASKEIKKLNNILVKKNISKIELNSILRLTDAYLKKNPFDVEILQIQIYVFKRMRLELEIKKRLSQIKIIKDAIFSTGNGLTENTAYYIIYVSHQKTILKSLELVQKGLHVSINTIEYVHVKPNKNRISKIYFNLSLCNKH